MVNPLRLGVGTRLGEILDSRRKRTLEEAVVREHGEDRARTLEEALYAKSQRGAREAALRASTAKTEHEAKAPYATDTARPIELHGVLGDPAGPNAGKKVTRLLHPVTRQLIQEIPEHEDQHFSPVPMKGKPGEPDVIVPFETSSGTVRTPVGQAKTTATGAGSAPMAAKVGQFGEMLKKYQDLLGATETLDVSLGQSAAQDIALHGVGVGSARIPGTKGVGSLMVNRTPQYAQYQAALSPWILAAAHALSGARINQDQVEQIRQSVELKPGDFQNPTVRKQKEKNLIDLINSIGGALPEGAVAEQEGQMDPQVLAALVERGYRYRSAHRRAAPNSGTNADHIVTVNGRVYHIKGE